MLSLNFLSLPPSITASSNFGGKSATGYLPTGRMNGGGCGQRGQVGEEADGGGDLRQKKLQTEKSNTGIAPRGTVIRCPGFVTRGLQAGEHDDCHTP